MARGEGDLRERAGTSGREVELALAASEAHLRQAQAVAHLGSWEWDVATGEVTWSDELYRIFGREPDTFEPTFEAYLDQLHPDDRAANVEHLQQALEEDVPYEYEYRIVRPDGEMRWLATRGKVARDGGRPQSMRGICWDVTERREAEERDRLISEITSDVTFASHVAADGTVVAEWLAGDHFGLTGYTVEESQEMGWRSLIHPLDRPDFEQRLAELEVGERHQAGVRIVRKDGDIRWTRITIQRVASAPGTIRFFGALQDVTPETLAIRALEASEARYRAVSELTSDVAYSYHLDEDGRFVVDWATEGIEGITGYAAEEVLAMGGWRALVLAEDRDDYERSLEELLTGSAVTTEFRVRAKDGAVHWLRLSARPRFDSDGVLRIYGAAHDFTERKETEVALAESEAHLREAQAVARMGSWQYDGWRERLTWSDEMFRIHGLDAGREPPPWDPYLELVHPDDRHELTAASRSTLQRREPYDFEYRIIRPDGEMRWVQARGYPVIEDDRLVGIRGTVFDVTERKLAELALAESEAKLRHAQAIAHLGHWRRDLGTDRLEWADETFRLVGVEPRSVEPTFEWFLEWVHPDDRDGIRDVDARLLESGEPEEHEFRVIRADGEVRWLHSHLEPELGRDGRPVGLVGVSQDVTERRRAEELHRAASEMVSDILFSYNVVAGRMVLDWVTPAFARLTGLDLPDPLPAELFRPVIHPDDGGLLDHAEAEVVAGRTHVAELRVVTVDGRTRWLRLYAQPVRHDVTGEVVRVYGAAQDVTERAEAERALMRAYERERDAAERLREADRLKDEFLSTASHELRTPLTAIVGFASVLSRNPNLDEPVRAEVIAKLERNALALGSMVERLLDFSRLEAGAVRLEPRPVDLAETVRTCLETHADEVAGHDVTIDVPAGLVAVADPVALTHVLCNLVGNAVKYTPAGSVVGISAEADDGEIVVHVTDAGPGLEPEVADRIFERFYRAPSTPAGQRGTGLGLAIARSYVEVMGGRIWVESEVGRGSTFSFSLPSPERVPIP